MSREPGYLFVLSGAGALFASVLLIAFVYGRGDLPTKADQPNRRTVEARGVNMKWQFFEVEELTAGIRGSTCPIGSELTVQRGDIVDFQITSTDYIYVLSLPDGQREIGVPDMCHHLTFAATRPGRFELLSDAMCGLRLLHDEVQGVLQIAD